jgi:hypothetical protein
MFEPLEDVRERPVVTRRTIVTFLIMLFLLGMMVGAQLTDFFLRRRWSTVGIGETFLLSVFLWKLSVSLRKAFGSVKSDQHIHVQ